ncbi:MAG: gamma-glutamyltransferase [Planctomycetota bacterium]|nr:gamma-glutamyltransferase [Planctomycetota bacterium]
MGSRQSADAGRTILEAGGNAADAAVAAAFATAAGDAAITSLAGGGVFIHRDGESGEIEVCDFFVSAPGLGGRRTGGGNGDVGPLDFCPVELDFGTGETSQVFHVGRGSAAVPGVIPGLVSALDRWGSLSLSEVTAPAVTLLREGIRLTPYQASCFVVLEPILRHSATGRRLHFDGGEKLLSAGSLFRNPELAETLERLGRQGFERVYRQGIQRTVLEEFGEESGGWLTPEDLERWEPRFREPLVAEHAGARVATNPPPSLGGRFILLTLSLSERIGVARVPEGSPERYRRLAAVFRAISEVRAEDPEIVGRRDAEDILVRRLETILGDSSGEPEARAEPRAAGNTTHVSVIDEKGNAAGVTISHGEGCGHWIGDTGLHMNNILGEEDLFPGGFHRFTPGERLATMMAPTIIAEPSGAVAVFGSGGANRIRTAMVQVISALLDDRLEVHAAVERGRLHFEGGVLSAEIYGLPGGEEAIREARKLARETKLFQAASLFFGGVHLVRRSADGDITGAGDPRRSGVVQVA